MKPQRNKCGKYCKPSLKASADLLIMQVAQDKFGVPGGGSDAVDNVSDLMKTLIKFHECPLLEKAWQVVDRLITHK